MAAVFDDFSYKMGGGGEIIVAAIIPQSQSSVVRIVWRPFNITVKHLKANIVLKERLLGYRAAAS